MPGDARRTTHRWSKGLHTTHNTARTLRDRLPNFSQEDHQGGDVKVVVRPTRPPRMPSNLTRRHDK